MPGRVAVVGIGPGAEGHITPLAAETIRRADAVVGYRGYFRFAEHLISAAAVRIERDLSQETERAEIALKLASEGKNVAVISSGDSGIYAMASVVHTAAAREKSPPEIEVVPGVSAFIAAAARLGAPLGHDFCSISLSDLLTPWSEIEGRAVAAAEGDFVTVAHNPKSAKRYWQLARLKEIFLSSRSPDTPAGIVRNVSRDSESASLTTLARLKPDDADMFSLVIIGSSRTFVSQNRMITPRDARAEKSPELPARGIYAESFRLVEQSLKSPDATQRGALAAIKRCVHATADFDYEKLFRCSDRAIERWSEGLIGGEIVTDARMVQAGISRRLLEKTGAKAFCLLDSAPSLAVAEAEGITRSRAAMKQAIAEHPNALFAVGNAPTALMEIADALAESRRGFIPLGVIAAPVGFVNVEQSKTRFEAAAGDVPFVVIKGKKGGSAAAAAIVNAALSFGGDKF